MGTPVKIVDLARKMIQLAGLRPDIDIRIEYSGLRPGEKMYEELFKQSENLLPTHHPKILKAQRCDVDSRFDVMLDGLVLAAQDFSDDTVRALIRKLVPEFRQSLSIDHSSVTVMSASGGQQERQPA